MAEVKRVVIVEEALLGSAAPREGRYRADDQDEAGNVVASRRYTDRDQAMRESAALHPAAMVETVERF